MIDPGLKDKVVLVTGGNNPHGIGAATAKAFAAQGAAVFIHYYRPPVEGDKGGGSARATQTPGMELYYAMQTKSADAVVEAIRSKGGRAAAWEANLADPAVVPELFDRAEQALGPVEVLVNNAADHQADTFLPMEATAPGKAVLWEEGPAVSTVTAQTADRHFSVNTRAVALMMAQFARRRLHSQEHWGRIINVSGDASAGAPGEISYWASKSALEAYSRAAAAELGPYGITVNVVLPGPVQSGYIPPEFEKELIRDIPMRRVGQPEDLADAIVFLASEQARWITGQLLYVHGGHRMAMGR